MGKDYFSQYISPNILIVPTMSFMKESPVKIISSEKASVHNESVKIEINNREVKEKNNQQLLSKVYDEKTQNRSWTSNYSQIIDHPIDKTEKLRSIKRKRGLEETEQKLQLPKKLKKNFKSREYCKSNVDGLLKSNSYKVDLTNKKGISNTSSSNTGVSKVSAKYDDDLSKKCQKEIVQHIKQIKSLKSIVKTTKNFQNVDKKNDLRLRLKRKLENANNEDKIKKEKKFSVKHKEDFSKFKRDRLFVTIQNDRNDTSLKQKDDKNYSIQNTKKDVNLLKEKENYTSVQKEKNKDLLIEKNRTNSPKKVKSNRSTNENTIKKIQLVINVTYTKQETSPPKTVKGDDKCALATEDLSFLDDFNVDEIVDSLKKCDNESNTNETCNSNNYINLFNDQESEQTNVISNVTVGTNKISNSEDIYSEITRKLAAFDAVKKFSSTRIRNDIANILIDKRTIENQPSNFTKMDVETKEFVPPLKKYQVKQKEKSSLQKISGVQLDKATLKENHVAKASSRNKKLIDLKNEASPQENIQFGKASRTKTEIAEKNKAPLKENNIVQKDKLSLKENRIKQIDEASPIENNIAQLDKVCLKKNLIEHVSAKEKNFAQLDKASTRVNKNQIEEKNEKYPKKNSTVQLDKDSLKKTRNGQNIKLTLQKEKKNTQLGKASLTKTRLEQNNKPLSKENNIGHLDEVSQKKNLTAQKNEVFAIDKNIALLDEAPVKKTRIEQKDATPSKEKNSVQLDYDSLKKIQISRKNPKEKRNSQSGKVSLTKTRIEQNNEGAPIGSKALKKNVIEQNNAVSAKKKYIAQVDEPPPKKNRSEQKNEASPKENGSVQANKDSLKKNQICGKNVTNLNENNNIQLYNATLKEKRNEHKNMVPLIENNIVQTEKQIKQKSETPLKGNNADQASLKENEIKHNFEDLNINNIVQIAFLMEDQIELKKEVKKRESQKKLDQIEQKRETPPKGNNADQASLKEYEIKHNFKKLNIHNIVQIASLMENQIELKKEDKKTGSQVKLDQIEQKRETPPKGNNADQASLKENEIKYNFEDLNKNNIVQIAFLMENQIELKKEDKKREPHVKLDQIEQKRETSLKINQFKQINNVQLTENLINKTNKVSLSENINDYKKNLNTNINYTNNTPQENPKTVKLLKENSTNKNVITREVPIKLQTLGNYSKTEEQEENKMQLLDSCFDAEETYMIQDISKRLHQKYSITDIIHRGTFSRILQCENSEGKSYIFKVLRKKSDNFLLGTSKYKMLKNIQEGIPVNKYNLVSIVDSCHILGYWCFVMDYYPKNLGQLLEKVDLDIHQVQILARQLVTAVTVLRNNGILHSDIKPSHILIDETNKRLKLCGFDLAMYIQDVVLTKDIGTINYRAPDIIMGYSAGFGVDVWSTAVVLYEMATKRQLFPGEHDNDILYKQMCTLGELPWDMVEDSYHGCDHFFGSKFMRRVGYGRKRIIFIPKFYTSNRLRNTLLLEENINWNNAKSDLDKREILAKLNMFHKLLQQMLVLHPRHRIPIEFVYLNPFIYKTASDDDLP